MLGDIIVFLYLKDEKYFLYNNVFQEVYRSVFYPDSEWHVINLAH